MNKNKSAFLNFSDKTVILYKLYYSLYIVTVFLSIKGYDTKKCTENVSLDVIQVNFCIDRPTILLDIIICFYLYVSLML